MNRLTSRLIVAFSCLLWATVPAGASVLGTAGFYNEFIFGDIFQENTDSEGRVAAAGNVTYSNMSVASEIEVKDPRYPELVVGGNLSWANGSVGYFSDINSGSPDYKKGDIVVGGSASIALNNGGSSVAFGSLTTGAALPFSFSLEQAYLQDLSTYWGQLDATGKTTIKPGEIFLTGTNPYLNIFSLSAADIKKNIGFHINVPEGSTTLVNISGDVGKMKKFGFYFNGMDGNLDGDDLNNDGQPDFLFPDNLILYNFFEATALNIAGIEVHGSILAPWADVLFSNGHIEGNLIAQSLLGTGEAHNELFNGNLPNHPVPEPATVILLGGGLIGVVAVRRRLKD